MAREQPTWFQRHILRFKPAIKCYGCGSQFSEKSMVNNSDIFMPTNIDVFFFQTNLRNQQLKQKQLKPLTGFLGMSLILGAVLGLLELPFEPQSFSQEFIEWSDLTGKISAFHEAEVVQNLKFEFDQILEKAKKIPASYKAGQ